MFDDLLASIQNTLLEKETFGQKTEKRFEELREDLKQHSEKSRALTLEEAEKINKRKEEAVDELNKVVEEIAGSTDLSTQQMDALQEEAKNLRVLIQSLTKLHAKVENFASEITRLEQEQYKKIAIDSLEDAELEPEEEQKQKISDELQALECELKQHKKDMDEIFEKFEASHKKMCQDFLVTKVKAGANSAASTVKQQFNDFFNEKKEETPTANEVLIPHPIPLDIERKGKGKGKKRSLKRKEPTEQTAQVEESAQASTSSIAKQSVETTLSAEINEQPASLDENAKPEVDNNQPTKPRSNSVEEEEVPERKARLLAQAEEKRLKARDERIKKIRELKGKIDSLAKERESLSRTIEKSQQKHQQEINRLRSAFETARDDNAERLKQVQSEEVKGEVLTVQSQITFFGEKIDEWNQAVETEKMQQLPKALSVPNFDAKEEDIEAVEGEISTAEQALDNLQNALSDIQEKYEIAVEAESTVDAAIKAVKFNNEVDIFNHEIDDYITQTKVKFSLFFLRITVAGYKATNVRQHFEKEINQITSLKTPKTQEELEECQKSFTSQSDSISEALSIVSGNIDKIQKAAKAIGEARDTVNQLRERNADISDNLATEIETELREKESESENQKISPSTVISSFDAASLNLGAFVEEFNENPANELGDLVSIAQGFSEQKCKEAQTNYEAAKKTVEAKRQQAIEDYNVSKKALNEEIKVLNDDMQTELTKWQNTKVRKPKPKKNYTVNIHIQQVREARERCNTAKECHEKDLAVLLAPLQEKFNSVKADAEQLETKRQALTHIQALEKTDELSTFDSLSNAVNKVKKEYDVYLNNAQYIYQKAEENGGTETTTKYNKFLDFCNAYLKQAKKDGLPDNDKSVIIFENTKNILKKGYEPSKFNQEMIMLADPSEQNIAQYDVLSCSMAEKLQMALEYHQDADVKQALAEPKTPLLTQIISRLTAFLASITIVGGFVKGVQYYNCTGSAAFWKPKSEGLIGGNYEKIVGKPDNTINMDEINAPAAQGSPIGG